MSTYRCPECGGEDLIIKGELGYRLINRPGMMPYLEQADSIEDPFWDDDSWTICQSCDYENTAGHFEFCEEGNHE